MKGMQVVGVAVVVLGLASLIWGGFAYKKTENVAQFGDLKMQVTENHQLTIPPWAGGIAILAGAAMVFAGGRRPQT